MAVPGRPDHRLRTQIAQLAAKIIAVEGVVDYRAAKRKAAQRLGLHPDRSLPTNVEVREALQEYQRLFQRDAHATTQDTLRKTASQAMSLLENFHPLLAGPVLDGTATTFSEVVLHVYCGAAEELSFFLEEHGIPFQHSARTLNMANGDAREMPAYRFLAGDTPIVLVVFAEPDKGCVPLSPVDGRPMERAPLARIEALRDPGFSTTPGK